MMRPATPRSGLTLRNFLLIGMLCVVIGAVPALASGIKQAHVAVQALFAPSQPRVAPISALRSQFGGARDIRLYPSISRLASWCQAGPGDLRLCRV